MIIIHNYSHMIRLDDDFDDNLWYITECFGQFTNEDYTDKRKLISLMGMNKEVRITHIYSFVYICTENNTYWVRNSALEIRHIFARNLHHYERFTRRMMQKYMTMREYMITNNISADILAIIFKIMVDSRFYGPPKI